MVTQLKMGILQGWLQRQSQISVTQPLSRSVTSNDVSYEDKEGFKKLGWRHFRRAVVFGISGQSKYLRQHIDSSWKKGLWLYKGVPQIGDSLMDLAPRDLLKNQGLSIDLYTEPHLAALYQDDPWFHRVLSNADEVSSGDYDFVIVPSHKNRSLKYKSHLFPALPWLSMHGFYTGPDFHRARFATQRLLDFLDREISPSEFALLEAQKLRPLPSPVNLTSAVKKIAIAMGGVNVPRTYKRWPALAKMLHSALGDMEVTLLGSNNGRTWADEFASDCAGLFPIFDKVGQTSLEECRVLIQAQNLFLAADGGLMHLGTTTGTPLVSIFDGEISPLWQLSMPQLAFALQSATSDVNDVPASKILELALRALQLSNGPGVTDSV